MSYQSGSSSINGSVTTAFMVPASTQTLKSFAVTPTGALQTAYTPAAGKTFYLYGVIQIGSPGGGTIYHADGTTALCQVTLQASGTSQGGALTAHHACVPLDTYTNSTPLKINCSGGSVSFYGVEV